MVHRVTVRGSSPMNYKGAQFSETHFTKAYSWEPTLNGRAAGEMGKRPAGEMGEQRGGRALAQGEATA